VALHKSPAIVIKSSNVGEADKIISFFSKRFGKVRALAKGVRRLKSKLVGNLQPITLVELIYFARQRQDLARINSCDIIYSFPGIKADFEKIKRGYYVLELIDLIIPEGGLEPKLFTTLIRFLRLMERPENIQNMDSLVRLFEWQILAYSGFRPRLEQCVFCKKAPGENAAAFSIVSGGLLCNRCSVQVSDAININPETLIFIKKAPETDLVNGVNWWLPEKLNKELKEIAQRYFSCYLGKDIKTARFLAL